MKGWWIGLVLVGGLWSLTVFAAKDEGVTVEFDKNGEEKPDPDASYLGVDRIFRNPALESGLSSGAETINRSLDSLMEGLFYNLLDNKLSFDLTDSSQFSTTLRRDVHSTSDGSYVVVDRFAIGPEFFAPLTTIQKAPINLGGHSAINVLNIYLRSDAIRLAENEEIPWYRWAINNWFGLLPLLTRVLPPSFNPNELYDPLKQVQTPFIFPFNPESALEMPIGSIRSYSFSGGVDLSWDMADTRSQEVKEAITAIEDVTATLPYTIFKTGEHRISVLRRSEYVVWIGLTDIMRQGHGLSASLGQVSYVFAKLVPYWSGLPAQLFPIDVKGTIADADKFDLLYEFDLRNPQAHVAYAKAVRGDFAYAHKYHRRTKDGANHGVLFHFNRTQKGIESSSENNRNLFVYRKVRSQHRTRSEIETTDEEGKFFTLESNLQLEDENWDALVGAEEIRFNDRIEIKVDRIAKEKEGLFDKPYRYEFKSGGNPFNLTLSMNINDRFIDVLEFREYIEQVRFFTDLPLAGVPYIPLRENEKIISYRKNTALSDPLESVDHIHVTPTHLGSFNASAAVFFSYRHLEAIFNKSDDKLWEAFASAFGIPRGIWDTEAQRSRFFNQMRWLTALTTYPLRLFNIRIASADAIREATYRILALRKVKAAKEPMEKLEAFDQLLDTDYPAQLARAFLYLSPLHEIPRKVTFSTKAKGIKGETKMLYESLNHKPFSSAAVFPPVQRYRIAREKLSAFVPTELRELRKRPVIEKVKISNRKVTPDTKPEENHLLVGVTIRDARPDQSAKVYVRFEQGGKVNVGRFVISEKVLDLKPILGPEYGPVSSADSKPVYEFYLTGPLSPLRSFFFEQTISSGELFNVFLAVSLDGQVWSEERKLEFRFQDRKVRRVK